MINYIPNENLMCHNQIDKCKGHMIVIFEVTDCLSSIYICHYVDNIMKPLVGVYDDNTRNDLF